MAQLLTDLGTDIAGDGGVKLEPAVLKRILAAATERRAKKPKKESAPVAAGVR